jgi:uncharacterized damage-inducible protein DinB
MKELFVDLAAYHLWADKRLLERAIQLPEEMTEREVVCSFPSLKKTFAHMLSAEHIWLQRVDKRKPAIHGEDFPEDFEELAQELVHHDSRLADWIESQSEEFLDEVIAYYNTRKEYYETPVRQILLQLFYHAGYHRGQVVAIFHQLGVTDIPPTDYIVYQRGRIG